jgi:uncharacterized protein
VAAPTIVVDTNVLVGALLGPTGPHRSVVRHCFRGLARPVIATALLNEYRDVWSRPEVWVRCRIDADRRQAFLEDFVSMCTWVDVYYRWRPNLRDEGDNHLVDLAVAGGAAYIVTNNLRDFAGAELRFPAIRVVGSEQMLRELAP